MRICPYCMKENASDICPECGRAISAYKPESHMLLPGTLLHSRYMVGAVLGEGGFGITYVGADTVLQCRVAVKEFYPAGMASRTCSESPSVRSLHSRQSLAVFQKCRDQFLFEARSLARFSNEPGIVSVKDYFEENGTVYIIMEYLDGITLQGYLEQNGRLTYVETVQLLMPVMCSLREIHRASMIHRDISPDNIMLSDRFVKLIDFGAARESANDQGFSVLLKHGYAPAEQYSREGRQGTWSDVYALCATMYRCITGTKPTDAIDRLTENQRLVPPSEMGIEISPDFERILLKGMAVKKEERYQTMDELFAALHTLPELQGRDEVHENADPAPAPAAQDTKVQPEPSPARKPAKRTLLLAGIGAGVLCLIGGAVLLLPGLLRRSLPRADNACGENAVWDLDADTGVLTIRRQSDLAPGYMDDWAYQSTDIPWYDQMDSIGSIVFEDGIVHVGANAFYECRNLTRITFTDSVETIGEYAFSYCPGVMTVTLPEHLTEIGDWAFTDCIGLTSVSVPETVTRIGVGAFDMCTSLKFVEIHAGSCIIDDNGDFTFSTGGPDDGRYFDGILIGDAGSTAQAFAQTHHITFFDSQSGALTLYKSGEMENYASLEETPWYALRENLREVHIAEGIHSIGSHAFQGCPSLTEVTLPQSLEVIGTYAFQGCVTLRSVELPPHVRELDEWAFSDCLALTEVTVPESVQLVQWGVFDYCEALTNVTFLNPSCEILDTNGATVANGAGDPVRTYSGVITGYPDSTAQQYAQTYSRAFVPLT